MGWFDEQIRQRKQTDQDVFEDSFVHIAGAVMGRRMASALSDDRMLTKDAIDEILKFYHVKTREIPDSVKDWDEQLEFLMRPHGIMRRNVTLPDGWYKDAMGPVLAIRKEDGRLIAIVPLGISKYCYFDQNSGKYIRVSKQNEAEFEREAIAFYKPFPLKEMDMRDLFTFMASSIAGVDLMMVLLAMLLTACVGMLLPYFSRILFSDALIRGSMQGLYGVAYCFLCVTVGVILITSIKNILVARIDSKIGVTLQAATMMRILSLPAAFFHNFSAGDLASRIQDMNALCKILIEVILKVGLTSVFSLLYILQIIKFAPSLTICAFLVFLGIIVNGAVTAALQFKISRREIELSAKENGMSFALLSGIQKIRLSGAEKRAFARWGKLYASKAALSYNPPLYLKVSSVIGMAISLAGTIWIYFVAIKNDIGVADYYGFTLAYGMTLTAFLSFSGIFQVVAKIYPMMEMVEPILHAVPEVAVQKEVVQRISGGVELSNVSFRYTENTPYILDNLSLKIRAGQYVAIVGKTGCGKSTLMRLLLGFETPEKGGIFFDGKDISKIDLRSLRRKIGVVMQDGRLFQGDIFSNITISDPKLTIDDAWAAAEIAGMSEDIKNMPMGMSTIISEGSGGISGGQRQRLLIARAVAAKPRILMFDEATSALDNLTQKKVSEALDGLKCTRIVIAHRLSTIRSCDRIIVLDHGKIIEDGKYDELVASNGFFAQLVERQQIR